MIFATVGTHPVPFDRLVQAVEDFAAQTNEEVIIQSGISEVHIVHAKRLTFIPWEDSLNLIQAARVVVSHGGAGTIMDVVSANVPLIIWPRRVEFGEHVNNHQLELGEAISRQGRAIFITNRDELFAALRREDLPRPAGAVQLSKALVGTIRENLNQLRISRR